MMSCSIFLIRGKDLLLLARKNQILLHCLSRRVTSPVLSTPIGNSGHRVYSGISSYPEDSNFSLLGRYNAFSGLNVEDSPYEWLTFFYQ